MILSVLFSRVVIFAPTIEFTFILLWLKISDCELEI